MKKSIRQLKVERLIQKDLTDILQKDYRDICPSNNLMTISVVHISKDLAYGKVYISFLEEQDNEAYISLLQEKTFEIRRKLSKKLKNQLRSMPEIKFFLDETASYTKKMDALFNDLNLGTSNQSESIK